MVNLPPEDRERGPTPPLNFDEFVALIVAFLALGGILLWGLTRGGGWQALPLLGTGSVIEIPELESGAANEEEAADLPQAGISLGQRPTTPAPSGGVVVIPSPAAVPEAGVTQGRPAVEPRPTPAPEAATSNSVQTVPEAIPPSVNIVDVPPTYWAYPFIAGLYASGAVASFPEGQFKPDQPMTRAELAALLNATLVTTPGASQRSFTDIASDYWASEAIDQVVAAGYMQGYPEGDFRPDQLIPREQVLVTLASSLGLQGTAQEEALLSRFVDSKSLSPWARSKVAVASSKDLVVNYPDLTLLRPAQPATRAEVVAMVYQVLAAQGRVEPIDSPYIFSGLQ